MKKTDQKKAPFEFPPLTREQILLFVHLMLFAAIQDVSDTQLDEWGLKPEMRNPYGFDPMKAKMFLNVQIRDPVVQRLFKIQNLGGIVKHIEFIQRANEADLKEFGDAPFGRFDYSKSDRERVCERLPSYDSASCVDRFYCRDSALDYVVFQMQLGVLDLYGLTTDGRKS